MNEEQFRKRLRGALGEPPPSELRHRLEASLTAGPSHRASFALGPVVASLALLLVAAFVGWRILYLRATSPATEKGSTVVTAIPNATVVDPLNCRLPVVVMQESGPPLELVSEPGFVATRGGQYVKDAAASIAGLPGGAFEGTDAKPFRAAVPIWYSEAAKRWLPVGSTLVAPDGRSYLWVRLLPNGSNYTHFKSSELHRYDLTTTTDHTLWTYPGSIDEIRWDASGVHATTVPPAGGVRLAWLIDPQTGVATQLPPGAVSEGPTKLPGDEQNGSFSFGSFGTDAQGHTLYRIGSRQAGDREWIFYESAPGQRVTIYKGKQGDPTGFDPSEAMGDGTGVWFSDYETSGLWYWDQASGLHKIAVKDLPGTLPGLNSSLYVNPAGHCM
jgi:hypothetical protein